MSVDLSTPEAQKAIADAKTLGVQLAADALAFGHSLIVTLTNDLPADLPDISNGALSLLYAVIPAQERGTVQMLVGAFGAGTIKNVDSLIVKEGLTALGLASNRLDAFAAPYVSAAKAPASEQSNS